MDNPTQGMFYNVSQRFVGYLPNLFAGLVLIGFGCLLGWLVKRVTIQVCVLLRLERLLRNFQWSEGFSRADVRHALFNLVGNAAFFVVFLIFLNATLDTLQLNWLSKLLEKGVLFLPRLLLSLVILTLGWLIAGGVGAAIQKALTKEDIPRATLFARFSKGLLLLFFSAMALAELDVAREIVVIGFSTAIVTLGILTIVLTWLSGQGIAQKILETLKKE